MIIKNKKEITLSKEDIESIVRQYLDGYNNGEYYYSFRFKVVNKMIPGPDPHDGYDNYVFDSLEVVITSHE
jgi:hypothetical protein